MNGERIYEPDDDQPTGATRARLVVLLFICVLSFVFYLDRLCMGQALTFIKEDLDLSDTQMGLVLAVFGLAYGVFEVHTGHWGDRIGARAVLLRIVLWWSAFTALTAVCWNFLSLLVMRFLFGAGEAGGLPNIARVVRRWFPPAERGRVQGLMMAATLVGGTVAPVLTGYLIAEVGWRYTFVIFAVPGVVWALAFAAWFRDDPAQHPAVNEAELRHITVETAPLAVSHGPIPWRAITAHRSVWLLSMIMIAAAFTSYFYYFWYPTYLKTARGVGEVPSRWLAGLVLAGGAAGTILGGAVNDWINRHCRQRQRVRSSFAATVYFLSAPLLLANLAVDDATVSAVFTALSFLVMMSQQPLWWTSAIELGGRHLGAVFGLMNGLGTIGAMSSPYFFGAFRDWRAAEGFTGREQSDPAYFVYAAALIVAGGCWLLVDTSRPVRSDADGQET
jgi:sugar phosphate permease